MHRLTDLNSWNRTCVRINFSFQGELQGDQGEEPVVKFCSFLFLLGSVSVCHLDRKGKRLQLALTGC